MDVCEKLKSLGWKPKIGEGTGQVYYFEYWRERILKEAGLEFADGFKSASGGE